MFKNLNLIDPILKAVKAEGYETPTPIQAESIPIILEGKDLLGCAQTGTGKTAAFSIPMLQNLYNNKEKSNGSKKIKALILTPTRELAIQINDSIAAYGKFTGLKHLVIFGGVPQKKQVDALKAGVDILTATPGRLLDLMQQGFLSIKNIEIFILDEADRMLDMGFIIDVKKIIKKLPENRQTLLFSATMPKDIQELANSILRNPVNVAVTPVSSTVEIIDQHVYYVGKGNKKKLLLHLLEDEAVESALVFMRTKHGANKIVEDLLKQGINAEAIHGNKKQSARQKALNNFKSGKTRVLIATDIAARGIDIDDISHVINYELPESAETYVHRIGRTGRAGAGGTAYSFCDQEEGSYLKAINKLIKKPINVVEEHPFVLAPELIKADAPPPSRRRSGSRGGSDRRRSDSRGKNRPAGSNAASGKSEGKAAPGKSEGKSKSGFGKSEGKSKSGFGKSEGKSKSGFGKSEGKSKAGNEQGKSKNFKRKSGSAKKNNGRPAEAGESGVRKKKLFGWFRSGKSSQTGSGTQR